MREIKFRVFDKERNKMTYEDKRHWFNGAYMGESGFLQDCTLTTLLNNPNIDIEIMQYTGLNDKNGKEIYEGDICKSDEGNIQEVVWENNSWMYKLKVVKSYQGESYVETIYNTMRGTSDKRFGDEVISNIYEAKDLLEVADE